MKKLSLKSGIQKIRLVALRFPFTLFFLIGLTVLLLLQIHKSGFEIKPARWVFFSLGIGLSLSISLFTENFKSYLYKVAINLLAVILLLTYCFILPDKFQVVDFYQVITIGITIILSFFVVQFFRKGSDNPFWEFSKNATTQLIISSIFAQILFSGIALALLSLKELFKIDIQSNVYGDIAVLCYTIFMPIYFMANLPNETEVHAQELNFNTFFKILGLYILLPILTLYSLILYVYLFQIVLKWQLPNGWVSMLVSVLGLGGFLCMFILYPLSLKNENKFANLLSRYFPVLLFPLLILMSIGIFRRLGDYGMTVNRLYILILNLWLYGISIYLFITKSKHLKWIVISFASVLFLSSVGNWSVYSITKHKMLTEITQLLTDSKLIKNGKIIDNSKKQIVLKPEISKPLSEDIKYLVSNFGVENLQPFFRTSIKKQSWNEINSQLGISEILVSNTYFNAWTDKKNATIIGLSAYKSLIFIPSFNSDKTKIMSNSEIEISLRKLDIYIVNKSSSGDLIRIQLKPKLKELLKSEKNQNAYPLNEMSITGGNYKLIITSVSGNYYSINDSIHLTNCDAQLFLK